MGFYLPRKILFTRFLDTDGDGTGTIDAIADTSGAADEFLFTASARCIVARMLVSVSDTAGINAEEYGNLGGALANGITILVRDGNDVTLMDFTGQAAIKTNAEWGAYCFDVDVKSWSNAPVNELLVVRWTFEKYGTHLILNAGDDFVVTVNDDMDGLLSHRFLLEGHYI